MSMKKSGEPVKKKRKSMTFGKSCAIIETAVANVHSFFISLPVAKNEHFEMLMYIILHICIWVLAKNFKFG